MLSVRADMNAAATDRDNISEEIDQYRLNELLAEWQSIPLQRKP